MLVPWLALAATYVGLIFTSVKKLKPCGSNSSPCYTILNLFSVYLKVQGDDGEYITCRCVLILNLLLNYCHGHYFLPQLIVEPLCISYPCGFSFH